MASEYRLAPAVAARLLGLTVAGFALLIAVATALVVLFALPILVLGAAVLIAIAGIFVIGSQLTSRARVLRLTDDGYRVQFVRGAGVKQARWADVEELATDTVAGAPCLVFRLKGGDATVLPVDVVAGDREELVREVGRYLTTGR